jgi:cytoskeletal protein CcmA (bactofilin family)
MSTSDDSDKRTVVEHGTRFKGALSSKYPICVSGEVEGELSGPFVEVTETGVVSGRLKVTELRSRGEIAGEIDADEVQLSGRIRDRTVLRAKLLEVKQELTFGECEIAIGSMPDKAAAVATAAAAALPRGKTAAAPAPEPAAAVPEEIAAEKTDVSKPNRPGGQERTAEAT